MKPKPRKVRWWNLPYWAFRTVGEDVHFYRRLGRDPRGLDWARFASLLRPNLTNPVFIVGAARSGTTFLGDSIGTIPEISYHHEPVATKAAAAQVFTGEWSERNAARFYRLVYRWLMRIHLDGDLRFAEKTPRHSTQVGFFLRSFPGAKFLHIVRDGRAAALSHSKQMWLSKAAAEGERVLYGPGGGPFGPFARYWVEPERAREFETTSDIRRMAWAWRRFTEMGIDGLAAAAPGQVLSLRYEDLVMNPQADAERILDFLEIDRPASRDKFRQALSKSHAASVDAWRRELAPAQIEEILDEAGPLLRRLGYVD